MCLPVPFHLSLFYAGNPTEHLAFLSGCRAGCGYCGSPYHRDGSRSDEQHSRHRGYPAPFSRILYAAVATMTAQRHCTIALSGGGGNKREKRICLSCIDKKKCPPTTMRTDDLRLFVHRDSSSPPVRRGKEGSKQRTSWTKRKKRAGRYCRVNT